MQRLFATFPTAGPGIALLLLRLSVAAAVLIEQRTMTGSVAVDSIRVGLALGVAIGWFTPILAALCCLFHLAALVTDPSGFTTAILSLDAAALTLMGPGAYSIDARLFGRRVLVAPRY
jgi:hypothetical protein